MLKVLRKKGVAKKILWFITVVIILSFGIFWNVDRSRSGGQASYAGKIFGTKISLDQFEKAFRYASHQAIMRYGDNFYKLSQFLNLEGEAWDRLILVHEGKKRRIRISDAEVIDAVKGYEFFKRNGRFDSKIYNQILRYAFHCEARDFEEGIRESLIFAKLYEQETLTVTVSDEEVKKAYQEQSEQAQISYVLFPADDYKKEVAVTPDETKQYYDRHRSDFFTPPQINIEYLYLSYPKEATEEQKTQIADTAKKIAEEFQTNSDFKKIAANYNAETGESGFFSKEKPALKIGWSYELLNQAFELNKDQISDPLITPQGYYILKLKEKKDSYIPDFTEAAEKVAAVVTENKSRELARTKAGEFLKQIKDRLNGNPGSPFGDIIKDLKLQSVQTPLFKRGEYLQNIGISREFQDAAFVLNNENKISDPVEIAKGYAVLHLDAFVPIDEGKFKEAKEALRNNLLVQKKNKFFAEFVNRLRLQANLEDNISKLKKLNRVPD